jgi:hypothetical protein
LAVAWTARLRINLLRTVSEFEYRYVHKDNQQQMPFESRFFPHVDFIHG